MVQAGKQAQALISDSFNLDFIGLFSADTSEIQQEQEKPVESEIKSLTGQQLPAQALLMQRQRAEEEQQRTKELYGAYQENIKKSEQLQTEILKGVNAGEDIYSLFLKAVEAISRMTSNPLFLSQIEEKLKSIYGACNPYRENKLRQETQL